MSLWRALLRCAHNANVQYSQMVPKLIFSSQCRFMKTASSPFSSSQSDKQNDAHGEAFSESSVIKLYSVEQQNIILKVLNESTVEELRQYEVTKTRASNLIRHRRRYGSFKKLEEILEVDGFGVGLVQNFCDSVVYGLSDDSKKQQNSLWQQICHPSVSEGLKQKIDSVVSLQLLPHEVLWLHLSRDLKILEWERTPLGESARSYDHKASLELAHQIEKKLPNADAYLMERRQLKPRQCNIPMLLRTIQIESMLTALLNREFSLLGVHEVFTIKKSVVGRFFSLKVGNENVSSQTVIKNLLSGMHCMDLRRVHIDPSLSFWYDKQHSAAKEELAFLLLQAVAFYELEIIKKKS